MTLDQLRTTKEAISQQQLRLEGMIQLLTQLIEQAEAAAAPVEVKE